MTILQCRDVHRVFGGVHALRGVSFGVKRGEITAVIGPNGAGKTTLFNLITGVFPPSEGEVKFGEKAISGSQPFEIAALGITRTFQNLQIFRNMSVLENVKVGCHTKGQTGLIGSLFPFPWTKREEREMTKKAMEKLDLVGLSCKADEPAVSLAFGQQRLLEIARALALEPKILLLDEPAAGLNATETRELVSLLYELKNQGITIVLVEHDMETVMEVADQILVLNFGAKIAYGTPGEIQQNQEVITAYLGEEAV